MGRMNQRGMELSFKPYGKSRPGGRWTKKVDGKLRYFGAGQGVSDRKSYKTALSKYRSWVDQQAALSHVKKLRAQVMEHVAAGVGITDAADLAEYFATGKTAMADERVRNDPVVNGIVDRVMAAHVVDEPTNIDAMRDDYLAAERLRRDRTTADPNNIRRKERLSAKSYRSIEHSITAFCDWAKKAGHLTTFTDAAAIERVLRGYRSHLESQLAKSKITGSTVNARTAYLRRFFDHLWRGHHIDEMPRCIMEVTRKYSGTPDPKPLDGAVVRKLWKAAEGRERALLALGLNCGAYAAEISDMRMEHVVKKGRETYLAKRRGKTGVAYKIKLWPVTVDLIKKHADGTKKEDLMFVTETGLPLVHQTGKSESDSVSRMFKELTGRAKVTATWSQLRDTTAVAVKGIGSKMGVQGLEDQLLAHATHKVSRFYADQSPADLETTHLDDALEQYRKHLKLK